MKVHIINGANLNMLGLREPHIYGTQNMEECLMSLRTQYKEIEIAYEQSNIEGELVNFIQKAHYDEADYIILNAGGYTHTSVVITDAISAVRPKCVEVHLSNIFSREDFRRNSLITKVAVGIISGFGTQGYRMALEWCISDFNNQSIDKHGKEVHH